MDSTIVLAIPPIAIVGLIWAWFGRHAIEVRSFFTANKSIGFGVAAVSFPVCWTWANTLVIGPQKAYEDGLIAVYWFSILNAVALLVFFLCMRRMFRVAGPDVSSFTGFVRERFGVEMTWVYTLGILGISVYAVVGQLIGALVLLNFATGWSKEAIILGLAPVMLLLASWRGIESSFAADMVKAMLISIVLIVILFVMGGAGEDTLLKASEGAAHKLTGFWDWNLLRPFVIPLAISWIAGGAVDNQLYQRGFSLDTRDPSTKRALWFGIVPFGVVVLMISSVGLLAPLSTMNPLGGNPLDHQLAGLVAISTWMPMMGNVFIITVAAALLATGASALNASASAWARDVIEPIKPAWHVITVSRILMVVITLFSLWLALSGVTLVQLVLFIGSFRGALLFPTVLGLFSKKGTSSRWFFVGIAGAMIAGPVVAYISGDNLWGGVTALGISGIACVVELIRNRT